MSAPTYAELFAAFERTFIFICHNCPLGPTNDRTEAGKLIDSLRVPVAEARDLLDEQVPA